MKNSHQPEESLAEGTYLDAWAQCCMELAWEGRSRDQSPWRIRKMVKIADVFHESLIERLSDGPAKNEPLVSKLRTQAGFFLRESIAPLSTREGQKIAAVNDIFQEPEGRVYRVGSDLAQWAADHAEGRKPAGDFSWFKARMSYYFFKLFLMNQSVCDDVQKKRAFLSFENNRAEFENGFQLILDAIEGKAALRTLPVDKRIERVPDLLLAQAMGRPDLIEELFEGQPETGQTVRHIFLQTHKLFSIEPRTWRLGRLLVDATKAMQESKSLQGNREGMEADASWFMNIVRAYKIASDPHQKTASYVDIADLEDHLLSRYRPLCSRPDLREGRSLIRKNATNSLSIH